MDPNETLKRLRKLVARNADGDSEESRALRDLTEICEYFEALDGWMSKGGFSPDDWRRRI